MLSHLNEYSSSSSARTFTRSPSRPSCESSKRLTTVTKPVGFTLMISPGARSSAITRSISFSSMAKDYPCHRLVASPQYLRGIGLYKPGLMGRVRLTSLNPCLNRLTRVPHRALRLCPLVYHETLHLVSRFRQ